MADNEAEIVRALNGLQASVDKLDSKWDPFLQEVRKSASRAKALETSIAKLNQAVFTGNGAPSLISQVAVLSSRVEELIRVEKELLERMENDLSAIKSALQVQTPEEHKTAASVEKWKTAGKVAGIITLATPGILALFGARP